MGVREHAPLNNSDRCICTSPFRRGVDRYTTANPAARMGGYAQSDESLLKQQQDALRDYQRASKQPDTVIYRQAHKRSRS